MATRLIVTFLLAALAVPGTTQGAIAAQRQAERDPLAKRPAAQGPACTTEAEPNDEPAVAASIAMPTCLEGRLAGDDTQDLALWTLDEAMAGPWAFDLVGVPGAATRMQLLPITSEPGAAPVAVSSPILALDVAPDATEPSRTPDVLLPPGRYVVAVFRSPFAIGEPADPSYRLDVREGATLPPVRDGEPNDGPDTALPLTDAFALSGDNALSGDWYAWAISEEAAGPGWRVSVRGQVGGLLTLDLADTTGRSMVSAGSDALGGATIPDLDLAAGTYHLLISPAGEGTHPYVLQAERQDGAPFADPEPNDAAIDALRLDPGTLTSGRLSRPGDRDVYTFSVDDALAAVQLDAKLLAPTGPERRMCLAAVVDGAAGIDLVCASGTTGVALRSLVLPAGSYAVTISGEPAPNDPYHLRVDGVGAPVPDFESEPNDAPLMATGMDGGTAMRGRLQPLDTDTFRVRTTGEPQLWQVDAVGERAMDVRWIKPDGTELGRAAATQDGTHATLNDMLLVPGEHWFRVAGEGEYELRLTPLGPPDPAAEREPNNDAAFAQPLLIGEERLGRLGVETDHDVSRLSLSALEHVRVRLETPPEGLIEMGIEDSRGWLLRPIVPLEPGATIEYEALLPPGDYGIHLGSRSGPSGRYRLSAERLDPFALPDDLEPNDEPVVAPPMPGQLRVSGSGRPGFERDWYALPPLPAEGVLSLRVDGGARPMLSDGTTEVPLEPGADGTTWSSGPLPAGARVRVGVEAEGPYELAIDPGTTGLVAVDAAPTAIVQLSLAIPDPRVAAYWHAGQEVPAVLAIADTGGSGTRVELDAATSHPAFSVALPDAPIAVPAGGAAEVPVTVRVAPDAWADIPVRVTLAARDEAGSLATTFAELTPDGTVQPVRETPTWSIPDALLGGLDVASTALGGVVIPSLDPDGEGRLHDGITPSDGGLHVVNVTLPVTLTVDLAGDVPVPVAGTILDPASRGVLPGDSPRAFELLLSEDGATFQPALSGDLMPSATEQAFVLPEPVMARAAQLRIDSTWSAVGALGLGEWKVIARPGTPLGPGDVNVADPANGGHVAWAVPQYFDQLLADAILLEDSWADELSIAGGSQPRFVIGFRDARAARISRLEWVQPPSADPARWIDRVSVAVSTAGPVGPWTEVGEWDVRPGSDGTVAPLVLAEPTWARYVRLIGRPVKEDGSVAPPATVRVFETPPDGSYRSILGEWGADSPAGPFEWLGGAADADPIDGDAAPDAPDAPESAVLLAEGERATGSVHRGRDVDWYELAIPPGRSTLSVTLRGPRTVGTSVTLLDADGTLIPALVGPGQAPGSLSYHAAVEPGSTVRMRVEQPPFSAVFLFDTSMSVSPYLPFLYGGLRSYTEDIEEGAEAILIMPFEEDPLLDDWSDQTWVLQDAVNRFVGTGSSSSAEAAMVKAIDELALRPGARAILLMTDAETTSYPSATELWSALEAVRPLIYGVNVGAASAVSRHFMQDWSAVGGGVYQYAASHSDVDRAFARMATHLRRPAEYAVSYETSSEPLPPPAPGTLAVRSAVDEAGVTTRAAVGAGVAVEIVLDTSGSMLERFRGRRRIDVAKESLRTLVSEALPEGTPVALRSFRQVDGSCESEPTLPLGPLDRDAMLATIDGIRIRKTVKTPLAAAIEAVAADLAGLPGPHVVVVVSDGRESCGGDPAEAVRTLAALGFDVTLNVVGLDLDRRTRKVARRLAELGGGTYLDARDPEQLTAAMSLAASAPFQVYDAEGHLVAGGSVDGAAIEVPPGTYRVVVRSEPEQAWDAVALESGRDLVLDLEVPEEP